MKCNLGCTTISMHNATEHKLQVVCCRWKVRTICRVSSTTADKAAPATDILAAVFDGHGGSTSAEWLRDHLHDDVLQHIDGRLLQPDLNAEPIPGRPGVTKSTRAEQFMTSVFEQADSELIDYLIGATYSRDVNDVT